ncbi:MAG: hypothetical protein HY401_00900 [Elusimicrobia bacterium]|nr:hypothetical protein [Elusimicrobiota bacterium]
MKKIVAIKLLSLMLATTNPWCAQPAPVRNNQIEKEEIEQVLQKKLGDFLGMVPELVGYKREFPVGVNTSNAELFRFLTGKTPTQLVESDDRWKNCTDAFYKRTAVCYRHGYFSVEILNIDGVYAVELFQALEEEESARNEYHRALQARHLQEEAASLLSLPEPERKKLLTESRTTVDAKERALVIAQKYAGYFRMALTAKGKLTLNELYLTNGTDYYLELKPYTHGGNRNQYGGARW